MEPAECRKDTRGEKEEFEELLFSESFGLSKFKNAKGGDVETPENAGGEDGAERV